MISALNIQQGWRLSPFWRLMVALWLVYIVWGTTYFAIGVAVQSFPPLWMNATRFTLAGVITQVAVSPSQMVRRGEVLLQMASPAVAELRRGASRTQIVKQHWPRFGFGLQSQKI